jgi:hypothetical protein
MSDLDAINATRELNGGAEGCEKRIISRCVGGGVWRTWRFGALADGGHRDMCITFCIANTWRPRKGE